MKPTYLILIALGIVFFSCSPGNKQKKPLQEPEQEEGVNKVEMVQAVLKRDPRTIGPSKPKSQYQIEEDIYKINNSKDPLYGYWVGAFGKNKINIALAYADKDSIYGHSVCAGNFRPIRGTIMETSPGIYDINMREPGDDQYDGEFKFVINLNERQLTGSWRPYKNTVSAKTFVLEKKKFSYSPYVGEYSEASTRYLEVDEVANMLPEKIEMIRNEIYARHGYSFQNLKIRRIFDAKDWYIPMSVDIRDQLTELEARNIDMLYNYEDYYEEYYDSFGR